MSFFYCNDRKSENLRYYKERSSEALVKIFAVSIDNMEADIETQPLLDSREVSNKSGSCQRRIRKIGIIFLIMLIILTTAAVCNATALFSSQSVINDAMQVSNVQVSKVRLDGWNKEGNVFQLSTNLDFWIDYKDWDDRNDSQSPWRKHLSRFTSETLVRTACFTLNNITSYDENGTLVYLSVKEPVCIDLRQDKITPLQLTVLVEPRIKNMVKVARRLLLWQDDNVLISSRMDITIGKRLGMKHLYLGRFKNLNVNWSQMQTMRSFLPSIANFLDELLSRANGINVQHFTARDSDNGFSIDIAAEPIHLPKSFEWVEWPVNSQIPEISWQVKLPDCDGEYTIGLPSLAFLSDAITVENPLRLSAFMDIEGPLPEKFLSRVCWSDGENAATPFTNFLNKLLNASEMINVEALGHPVRQSHITDSGDNFLVPPRALEELLQEVSFIPLAVNLSLNSDNSLEKVTIDGLRMRWAASDNRLVMSGKIVAFIGLPFYETNGEHITVGHVKGTTKLFHNGIHFLTVPMRVWTPSSSKIIRDKKNQTVLKLFLNIHDDEVQVASSVELTKVLNEVIVMGHAEVDLSTRLDLLVTTHLGQLVLLGLKGEGMATVRS